MQPLFLISTVYFLGNFHTQKSKYVLYNKKNRGDLLKIFNNVRVESAFCRDKVWPKKSNKNAHLRFPLFHILSNKALNAVENIKNVDNEKTS